MSFCSTPRDIQRWFGRCVDNLVLRDLDHNMPRIGEIDAPAVLQLECVVANPACGRVEILDERGLDAVPRHQLDGWTEFQLVDGTGQYHGLH